MNTTYMENRNFTKTIYLLYYSCYEIINNNKYIYYYIYIY